MQHHSQFVRDGHFVGKRSTNFRGVLLNCQLDWILCESMNGIRSITSEITF